MSSQGTCIDITHFFLCQKNIEILLLKVTLVSRDASKLTYSQDSVPTRHKIFCLLVFKASYLSYFWSIEVVCISGVGIRCMHGTSKQLVNYIRMWMLYSSQDVFMGGPTIVTQAMCFNQST